MKRRFLIAVLGTALIGAMLGGVPARAATTLTVHTLSGLGRELPAYTVRAMAPEEDGAPTVKVMEGDTLKIAGFSLILQENEDPYTWHEENAREIDSAYGTFASDPDPDVPNFLDAPTTLNPFLIHTPDGCGTAAETPCHFDGKTTLNPFGFFSGPRAWVQIDAKKNSEFWIVPQTGDATAETALKVEVTDDPAAVTTQESLDAYFKSAKASDRAAAEATFKAMQKPRFREEDGHRIYQAYAGYESGPIVFDANFPYKLTIRKGDEVEWNFDYEFNFHTVTFPFKKGVKLANEKGFIFACDPDGSGEGPDNPPDFEATTPCEDMTQFEFDLARKLTAEAGDGVFPGGFENSGFKGADAPTTSDMSGGTSPWSLTFDKRSTKKGYRYVCAVHGSFMDGRIRVK